MFSRNETPLFRFLIVFISGILAAVYFPILPMLLAIGSCFFFIATYIIFSIWQRKRTYRQRWMAGISGLLIVLFSGYALTLLHDEKHCHSHFRNFTDASGYVGYICEPVLEKTGSYKTFIKMTSISKQGGWQSAVGKCLLYFTKDSVSAKLRYGDLIFFEEHPAGLRAASNPSQFDYKRWLGFNQVYDQVNLGGGKCKLLEQNRGSPLFAFSYRLRDRLLKIFFDHGIAGQQFAVLSALILGCDDGIDQEVIKAYAASGALHVLSVSGLHVGIIYVAINFMLGFMERSRRMKLLKSSLIIIFLWFYALLTGLSPSVLRSATMLTFIIIGSMTRQHASLYNTLAASAFFLLVIDPYLIMQVGFQLSYTAVLGIVLLYQPILGWFEPRGWLLNQIWSITAVSIAAQVATFPLGLLYFHQFPVYFLLSNMIVIPISTIIIYGGVFLLMCAGWFDLASIVSQTLSWIVQFMNEIVMWIEQLPFSLVTGISISVIETWLIYISIGAMVSFLMTRRHVHLLVSVMMLLLVLTSQVIETVSIRNQKQLIVFHIRGKGVVNIIDGKNNFIKAPDQLLADESQMLFNIHHYWWECGLNETSFQKINMSAQDGAAFAYRNFMKLGKCRLAMVNDSLLNGGASFTHPLDVLILSDNCKIKLTDLAGKFRFKKLVVDSSFPMKTAGRLVAEARQLGIDIYSVPHQGAFVYHIPQD